VPDGLRGVSPGLSGTDLGGEDRIDFRCGQESKGRLGNGREGGGFLVKMTMTGRIAVNGQVRHRLDLAVEEFTNVRTVAKIRRRFNSIHHILKL